MKDLWPTIKTIIKIGVIMLILDAIYLNLTKGIFSRMIENIQGEKMQLNIYGAIICYILLIGGLYYFIIKEGKSVLDAFLFGFVIYGVYDSTNYAIIKKWSYSAAIMDAVWGGILMALTTLGNRWFAT